MIHKWKTRLGLSDLNEKADYLLKVDLKKVSRELSTQTRMPLKMAEKKNIEIINYETVFFSTKTAIFHHSKCASSRLPLPERRMNSYIYSSLPNK